MRHGGQSKSVEVIVRKVVAYVDEVRQGKEVQGSPAPSMRPMWIPPRKGYYKINVDGGSVQGVGLLR